MNNCVG